MYIWIIIAFLIILADQLAKFFVALNIGVSDCIHAIPYLFDFVYVKNTGAAFSILSNHTAILAGISVLFCVGVLAYFIWKKPQNAVLKTALTLLFSGAFGNAIDRVARGYVVDFISTAFMRFPVFNIADIAVTCGAVLLVVYILFFDKDEKNNGENNASGIKSE